jgi:hypothetical protein
MAVIFSKLTIARQIGSIISGLAFVASWQAILSFRHALKE